MGSVVQWGVGCWVLVLVVLGEGVGWGPHHGIVLGWAAVHGWVVDLW